MYVNNKKRKTCFDKSKYIKINIKYKNIKI